MTTKKLISIKKIKKIKDTRKIKPFKRVQTFEPVKQVKPCGKVKKTKIEYSEKVEPVSTRLDVEPVSKVEPVGVKEPWEVYKKGNNSKEIKTLKIKKEKKKPQIKTTEWIEFHTKDDKFKLLDFLKKYKSVVVKIKGNKITMSNISRNPEYKIYEFIKSNKLRIKDFG